MTVVRFVIGKFVMDYPQHAIIMLMVHLVNSAAFHHSLR